ncbi:MAG: DNA mismatch repair endonuclease MutL [Akkermansiaceae bacterium]
MSKIQILSDVLASQVAAGEVVERPASVVKEMVENSIDADAKHVEVEIHKGGGSMIKITDDGCGMNKEDALMCLERHATSKLKDVKQLAAISTMGFRGEAVPSVASVSKMRIMTREVESVEGSEITVDGGIVKDVRVTGMQHGTVFEIKNLFFNVPARRKFMRTESTESAHVEHQVKLHALAYPEVRFTFKKDGRVVFDVPATSDRRTRIAGLAGAEIGRALIEVPHTEVSGMEVLGYVLPADYARKGRRQQFVFLNGRPVEDAAISRAIKDGFKGGVVDGLNPTAWLWISMDPALVDVNVHPAKKEVRFHKPYDVRNLVLTAVEARRVPQAKISQVARGEAKIISRKSGEVSPVVRRPIVDDSVEVAQEKVVEKSREDVPVKPAYTPDPSPSFPAPIPQQEVLEIEEVERPRFKILSALHDTYILMEGDDGLVLLEPKAARDRIAYEKVMLMAKKSDGVLSQGLLVPEVIDLDSRDLDVVMSNLENFSEAGISIEPFGGGSIQVRSLPSLVDVEKPREFITAMIDELIETQGGRRGKQMAFEAFAETLANRISKYETCDLRSVESLLDEMFGCDLPYCTPDGRPTLIQISIKELEKKFKG